MVLLSPFAGQLSSDELAVQSLIVVIFVDIQVHFLCRREMLRLLAIILIATVNSTIRGFKSGVCTCRIFIVNVSMELLIFRETALVVFL